MSIETNKKIVTEFLESFSTGDPDAILAAFSETGTWLVTGSIPISGTYDKQAFRGLVEQISQNCASPIRFDIHGYTAEDDRVAVEAESHFELKNGRTYQNRYHFFFEVRDGRVERVIEYMDTKYADEVLCS